MMEGGGGVSPQQQMLLCCQNNLVGVVYELRRATAGLQVGREGGALDWLVVVRNHGSTVMERDMQTV